MIDYDTLTPLVKKAASAAHSSFPQHHEVSDTEQTIWLWVFEKKNTIAKIFRDTERPEGVLYDLMLKEANGFLKKEDAVSHGYSEEDAYYYTTEVVKTLLEDVFDYEDWQSFAAKGDGQPSSKVQANMTGDRIAMLADVKSALEKLGEDQYDTLAAVYRDGLTPEELGERLDITEDGAKGRVRRAVGAVQRRLGSRPYSDLRAGYEGRTEPVSAAEAQYTVERDYEG